MIAIERGILERLRHQRAGELLHLQSEAAHPGALCSARSGLIRSIVSVSRRKSKMPSSAANQSARALSMVSEINARSLPEGRPSER